MENERISDMTRGSVPDVRQIVNSIDFPWWVEQTKNIGRLWILFRVTWRYQTTYV